MTAPGEARRWRSGAVAVALAVGLLVGSAGCGSSTGARVTTGEAADAGAVADPSPVGGVPASGGGSAASVVAGLDVAELAAVLDAPGDAARRAVAGPVLERIEVPGATAWRLTVPGPVVVGGARVEVLVGERTVGVGVPAADLGSLAAVTLDGSGLDAGEPVLVRRPGRPPVAVGALEVVA